MLWKSFGKEEKAWVNRARLIGLFEIEWKTPCRNILVEFLNNWQLNPKPNKIKVMLGDEQKTINEHVLAEVFRMCHTRETKIDWTKMFDARVTLADIVDGVLTLTTPMKSGL